MKICYIPAVSTEATSMIVSKLGEISFALFSVASNIAWAVIFLKVTISLIKAYRSGDYKKCEMTAKSCFLAGCVLFLLEFIPKVVDIVIAFIG